VSEEEIRVIICRSGNGPLGVGCISGYECAMCKEPLQLTRWGHSMLAKYESLLLCNECGLLYVQIDANSIAEYKVGPAAKAQVDRGNTSRLAQWVRRKTG
jgi:hypothetical protein